MHGCTINTKSAGVQLKTNVAVPARQTAEQPKPPGIIITRHSAHDLAEQYSRPFLDYRRNLIVELLPWMI